MHACSPATALAASSTALCRDTPAVRALPAQTHDDAAHAGGIFVTDVSNAARTWLMDIKKLQWDPDLLQRFRLSTDMLPRICSNAEVYGHVRDGPLTGVPIAGAPLLVRAENATQKGVYGRTQLENPYGAIACFEHEWPHTAAETSGGVTNVLGHPAGNDSAPCASSLSCSCDG